MESSAAPEQVETLFVQKEERPLFPGVTPDSSETQPDKGEKMKNQIPLGHPHDLSTDSRLSRQFLLAVSSFVPWRFRRWRERRLEARSPAARPAPPPARRQVESGAVAAGSITRALVTPRRCCRMAKCWSQAGRTREARW